MLREYLDKSDDHEGVNQQINTSLELSRQSREVWDLVEVEICARKVYELETITVKKNNLQIHKWVNSFPKRGLSVFQMAQGKLECTADNTRGSKHNCLAVLCRPSKVGF